MSLQRRWFAILAVAICGCVFAAVSRTSSDQPPPKEQVWPRIVTHLDHHEVTVGDKIKMRQFIGIDEDVPAWTHSHFVKQVGFYHRGLKRIVFPNPVSALGEVIRLQTVFGGSLPMPGPSSHPSYDYITKDRKGYEFEFSAVKPGVYLLYAEWTFRSPQHGEVTISGEPALLFVRQPVDVQGKDIVDPDLYSGDSLEDQERMEFLYDHSRQEWRDNATGRKKHCHG
jgi:hypothetical protein